MRKTIAFLVQNFTHVTDLYFDNTKISDHALYYLKDLPSLITLSLRETTEITDQGIEILSEATPRLEHIVSWSAT